MKRKNKGEPYRTQLPSPTGRNRVGPPLRVPSLFGSCGALGKLSVSHLPLAMLITRYLHSQPECREYMLNHITPFRRRERCWLPGPFYIGPPYISLTHTHTPHTGSLTHSVLSRYGIDDQYSSDIDEDSMRGYGAISKANVYFIRFPKSSKLWSTLALCSSTSDSDCTLRYSQTELLGIQSNKEAFCQPAF